MISQDYKSMLNGKSVIREMSAWATKRGTEIGYDNVFDYSLGNPSVPVPQEFTDKMIESYSELDFKATRLCVTLLNWAKRMNVNLC